MHKFSKRLKDFMQPHSGRNAVVEIQMRATTTTTSEGVTTTEDIGGGTTDRRKGGAG